MSSPPSRRTRTSTRFDALGLGSSSQPKRPDRRAPRSGDTPGDDCHTAAETGWWRSTVPAVSPTPRWETPERERFRALFDEDPDAYDRSRPVAPAAVFDDLVTVAGL